MEVPCPFMENLEGGGVVQTFPSNHKTPLAVLFARGEEGRPPVIFGFEASQSGQGDPAAAEVYLFKRVLTLTKDAAFASFRFSNLRNLHYGPLTFWQEKRRYQLGNVSLFESKERNIKPSSRQHTKKQKPAPDLRQKTRSHQGGDGQGEGAAGTQAGRPHLPSHLAGQFCASPNQPSPSHREGCMRRALEPRQEKRGQLRAP